jgi:hypothetical protein
VALKKIVIGPALWLSNIQLGMFENMSGVTLQFENVTTKQKSARNHAQKLSL